MGHPLVWGSAGLSLVTVIVAAGICCRRRTVIDRLVLHRSALVAAAATSLLVFLLTWPSRPPFFSGGHGLGIGFLLGGIASMVACALALYGVNREAPDAPLPHTLAAGLIAGTLAVAALLIFVVVMKLPNSQPDALMAAAIGWLTISLLLNAGVPDMQTHRRRQFETALLAGTAFAAAAASFAAIAILRGLLDTQSKPGIVPWSDAVLLFLPLPAFITLIVGAPAWRMRGIPIGAGKAGKLADSIRRGVGEPALPEPGMPVWRLIAAALLMWLGGLAITRLFAPDAGLKAIWHGLSHSSHYGEQLPMAAVAGIGALGALLVWWRLREEDPVRADATPSLARSAGSQLGPPLIVLATMMVSFSALNGLGMGLVLTAAWAVAAVGIATGLCGADTEGTRGRALIRMMLFGTLCLLFQLATTRFAHDLHGLAFTDHYFLFGALLGAIVPSALSEFSAVADTRVATRLTRLILTGVLVLLVPTTLLALWGGKMGVALLLGMILAPILFEQKAEAGIARLPVSILALAVALAMTQWSRHVLLLTEHLTRANRQHIVIELAVVIVVILLAADYGGRSAQRHAVHSAGAPENEGEAAS